MESHTDYNTNSFLPLTHVLLAIAILLVKLILIICQLAGQLAAINRIAEENILTCVYEITRMMPEAKK